MIIDRFELVPERALEDCSMGAIREIRNRSYSLQAFACFTTNRAYLQPIPVGVDVRHAFSLSHDLHDRRSIRVPGNWACIGRQPSAPLDVYVADGSELWTIACSPTTTELIRIRGHRCRRVVTRTDPLLPVRTEDRLRTGDRLR